MSRRVSKKVYSLATNNWSLITEHSFLYDGWNLIQEVVQRPAAAPSTHTIQGQLNINPANSPQNEFVLTLPDGSTLDNFHKDFPGYSGPAVRIHIKPKGKLDGLLVDGAPYELSNSEVYDIASSAMTVHVYNDSIKKGKAMGRWWISIVAADATIAIGGAEEIGNQQSTITNSYVWGLDLSGSLQGAGGIGGLVSVTRSTSSGTATYYPCYDANGNITDYVDTNGVIVAHREYDPFGNTIVATGPMVNDFSFWFSTKYLDHETGLYYYGYRYYSPSLGRWLSRDPIGEWGGANLYGFVGNRPVDRVDRIGLLTMAPGTWFDDKCGGYHQEFTYSGFAGVVIQSVTIEFQVTKIGKLAKDNKTCCEIGAGTPQREIIYESIGSSGSIDLNSRPRNSNCTIGWARVSFIAKVYELPPNFTPDRPPSNWDNVYGYTRSINVSWDCWTGKLDSATKLE